MLRFGVLLPSLVRCGPRDWAQIAAGAGYFDQSHLIREFQQSAGMAPGVYAPAQVDQRSTWRWRAEKISNTPPTSAS